MIAALVACLLQDSAAAPVIRYSVRFASLSEATVTADFASTPAELFMNTSASGRADGFASFVRGLRATRGGSDVALTRDGARWRVAEPGGEALRVEYGVDLGFAKSAWPAGNEQAGISDGKSLYLVSKALFLDAELAGAREVSFELPSGWTAATPWPRAGASRSSFLAPDSTSLLVNSLVVGPIAPSSVQAERFEFTLVMLGDFGSSPEPSGRGGAVPETLAAAVREFVRLFPETPPTRYLVTLLAGEQDDAEAYVTSFAATFVPPLDEQSRIAWANTIAHEVFHFWCGHQIHGVGTELEWLQEGFTEYYANLALMRSGAFTQDEFLERVEHNLGHFEYFATSPLFDGVTLLRAGEEKSRNRFGVYGGGWAMALGLDHHIRRASNEERSLDDLMRLLVEEFGEAGTQLAFEDLALVVEDFAGEQARAWLVEEVQRGRPTWDVHEVLRAYGLGSRSQAYDGEFHAWADPMAAAAALQRRKRWAGF